MTQEIVLDSIENIHKACKTIFLKEASVLKTNQKMFERLDITTKESVLRIATAMDEVFTKAGHPEEVWQISRLMLHWSREINLSVSFYGKLYRYLPQKYKSTGRDKPLLDISSKFTNVNDLSYKKFRESTIVNGLTAAFDTIEPEDIKGSSKTTLQKVDEIVELFRQQIANRIDEMDREEIQRAEEIKKERERLNQKHQDGSSADYVSDFKNKESEGDGLYDYSSLNNFDTEQHDALDVVAKNIKEKYGVRVNRSDSITPVYSEEDIDRLEGYEKQMAIAQVNLDTTFHRTIRAFEKFREVSRQYPATDLMTMNRMIISLESLIEIIMPYIDGKFRRDLYQFLYISKDAIEVSPTYAAKNSGIPCATVWDPKTQKPVVRRMTKEQIEQVFPDKINQIVRLVNDNFSWWSEWSRKFVQNQCRAGEDRAVLISEKLSFLT